MISFAVKITNVPAQACYWLAVLGYYKDGHEAAIIAEEAILVSEPFHARDIQADNDTINTWGVGISDLPKDPSYISVKVIEKPIRILSGTTYVVDYNRGTVRSEYLPPIPPMGEFDIEGLLPMMPNEGPPLPRLLGIYWPWYEKATLSRQVASIIKSRLT